MKILILFLINLLFILNDNEWENEINNALNEVDSVYLYLYLGY